MQEFVCRTMNTLDSGSAEHFDSFEFISHPIFEFGFPHASPVSDRL